MKKWILCLAAASAAFSKMPQTPPAQEPDPDLFSKDRAVFSSHLEFLYWSVIEGDLDYAVKMRSPAWSSGADNYASGKYERTAYNIDPGFRIGLSYFRAPHYWEIWALYTRMTNRGKSNSGKPDITDEYLTGTWPQILTQPLAGAQTSIHLNYNVFDFLIDRHFIPNPHLRLRAIAGLTAAWMDQNWSIFYYDSNLNNTHIRSRWKYGGVGMRLGTMADWFWTNDLYLTLRGTFAVLVGPYRNRTKQTVTTASSGGQNIGIPLRDADYSDTRPATTVQLELGPSYQKSFSWARVEAFVGYEMTMWANVQEVYRSTASTASGAKETLINSGVLAFQGLTVRLTTDF